jgi:hypothetical protein
MPAEPRADAPMAIVPSWIEVHCRIPDGFRRGRPFRLYNGQLLWFRNFYLVRGTAEFDPVNPIYSTAFRFRRGLDVGPQKVGKSPKSAAHICVEAVGPSVFADWAGRDDGYACADHGCGCGWEYPYDEGEPMGTLRPTPWIQIIAVSEDGTGNVYKALRPMIELGPLAFLMPKTGEDFIRLPGDGLIEPVTSSDTSRVGARGTFVVETEVGFYTQRNGMTKVADTLHRNLAGMAARAALETNSWDPAQHSTAQVEYELAESGKVDDIYVQVTWPPKSLSFANKAERRKILRIVYPEDTRRENGGHVELEAIEAEAAAMSEKDPGQASRFFGNGRESGAGRAFDADRWKALAQPQPYTPAPKALIVLGGDGSKRWDHFSLIGTEIETGYQWPLGIWRPEDYPGHEVPMDVVDATLEEAYEHFDVWRLYGDPPYIETWIARWKAKYGEDRVIARETASVKLEAYRLRSWSEAWATGEVSHCHPSHPLCALFSAHVRNAFRHDTGYTDDDGNALWTVRKERRGSPDKIDSVPAADLSWEARTHAIAAGALNVVASEDAYAGMSEIEVLERMLA